MHAQNVMAATLGIDGSATGFKLIPCQSGAIVSGCLALLGDANHMENVPLNGTV